MSNASFQIITNQESHNGFKNFFFPVSVLFLIIINEVFLSLGSGSGSGSYKVLHDWLPALKDNNKTSKTNNALRPKKDSNCYAS